MFCFQGGLLILEFVKECRCFSDECGFAFIVVFVWVDPVVVWAVYEDPWSNGVSRRF